MTGVEMFTIIGSISTIMGVGMAVLCWFMNRLDSDVKSAITRIDAAHARIDGVHSMIMQLITSKRD